MGGGEFAFRNTHAGVTTGPFNAEKWVTPLPEPGDLILFPSHLLHEVPVNKGEERITLAFNAVPNRLDAWGYALSFQP
jgi:predicted 2-oxoglutarate/Fe(II)-dependent dioxygenase YbiX